MAVNFVELIKSSISPDVVSKLANFLGTDTAHTQTAVNTGLPAMLGSFIEKSSTEQGSENILKVIREGGFDKSSITNPENVFSGDDKVKEFISSGSGILKALFGDKQNVISSYISKSSELSSDSVSSVLGFLAPVVTGLIGKQVAEDNLDSKGLSELLSGQKIFLAGLIPAGLSGIIRNVIPEKITKQVPVGEKPKEVTPLAESGKTEFSFKKYLPWILILIAVIIIFVIVRSCGKGKVPPVKDVNKQKVETKKSDTTRKFNQPPPADAPQTGDPEMDSIVAGLGKFMKKKLPNGTELVFAQTGVERKLIAFIWDKKRSPDKETWFTFDRLLFESGKSTLKPSSSDQLKNVAEIMKAYPNVEIKIGGYTDSTGNEEANLKLSQERANSVMAELVKLGVAPKRMKAEGYGSKFPVAPNSNPNGRAKNRRIDIRVTKK